MLKPFSAEVMRNRLESILRRKQAFNIVYQRHEAGDLEAAVSACDRIIHDTPRYLVDALRFKGESLNSLGRSVEAETLYRQIIQMRPIPWARLGLAKSLHQQKKDEAAEEVLLELLGHSPELVAAYDLLSDVRLARKDEVGAQAALQAGVDISSRTVRRQQKLGNLAMDNGDLDTAGLAYAAAIEKGRHSVFITPADYGNLCRVQVDQGNLNGAMETLKKGKLALQASPEGQLVTAIVQSRIHSRNGNEAEALRALAEATRLRTNGAQADGSLLLDMAGGFLAHGRNEEADALISVVARNAHDSEAILSKARQMFEAAGRVEEGASVLSQATTEVRKLNDEGVMNAHKGDFDTAIERLLSASELAPNNPRILMNGIWVILKYLEQHGMNEEKLTQARNLLAEVDRLSPGHVRAAGLRAQLNELESRFGLRRRGI